MPARYISFQLGEGAKAPLRAHSGDAGWDLFVSSDVDIEPGATVDVHTNIKIKMPPYMFARIVGRSSSLRKHHLLVNEGIIDNGYTGELFTCIHNLGKKTFHVKKGMRLAQIIFHPIEDIRWSEVNEIKSAPGQRGEDGFGSTGI